MTYFRILFNEDISEIPLTLARSIVGREKTFCDLVLPDSAVSRQHCMVARFGEDYMVFDLHSRLGTIINGKPVTRARLKHGDNLELGGTIMEFRTDNERAQASLVKFKNAEEAQLLENFRMLPSGVKVRYRILAVNPDQVFSVGDTRMVGQGGVLLPVVGLWEMPDDCLFELELTWPNGARKMMMGEIIARVHALGAVCLKMHAMDRIKYEALLKNAKRGNWLNSGPS